MFKKLINTLFPKPKEFYLPVPLDNHRPSIEKVWKEWADNLMISIKEMEKKENLDELGKYHLECLWQQYNFVKWGVPKVGNPNKMIVYSLQLTPNPKIDYREYVNFFTKKPILAK